MFQKRVFSGKVTDSGPHLLITGGIHGDEFEPIFAIQRLISYFEGGEAFSGKLTLIPIANEAAFRRGHRIASEDGLDLARTFPGKRDGSITGRVAFELAELIGEADYYIDLHTGGTEFVVVPLTGYMLHWNKSVLETQRQMAHAFGLPFIWGTAANLEGRSLSVARDASVPAIYAEYLGGGRSSQEGIEAYFKGCLNVMSILGMRPQDARSAGCEPDVIEDFSENSGHMQSCHPAPVEGLFSPALSLGDQVTEGDLFGKVDDFTGENSCEIRASKTGRVIVLRTFPRVKAGDSCGVIA